MGVRYPQPDNEDAFEQMCLRFYRKLWTNESLSLYAKRGEQQDGVDIHDPAGLKPIRAVQCKHHEPTKTLPPKEIREEVGKAERSSLPVEHYVIATTAKKSRRAQDTVVQLNSRAAKQFTVEIHFWEDICERLGAFPRVQAEFIVAGQPAAAELVASLLQDPHLASMASRVLAAGSDEAVAGASSDIEQLLNERRLDAARHELDKLPGPEHLGRLSPDGQYKVSRLRGKLALETGEFEAASKLFLAAYRLRPDLVQAKQNQVLAYWLASDLPTAFALAQGYVAAGLTTPVMLCRLIESAPTLEALNEHMDRITSYLSSDEGINNALCHRLIEFGDSKAALEAAGRALTIAPHSPHAQFAAAAAAHDGAVKGDWRQRKAQLAIALTHYAAALAAATTTNYAHLVPEVLVNRAACQFLLGDPLAASADYRAAVTQAQRPALYAARAVSFFLHQGDFVSAWELLQALDQSSVEGSFLTALTEFHIADDDNERRRCLDVLRQLSDAHWARAVECRLHCVQCALLMQDPDLARSCITDVFKATCPFQAFTALAWIAIETDDKENAREAAEAARENSIQNAHPNELRLLATVFTRLDQDSDALDLLELTATSGVLSEDTKRLMACAQRLGRHDLLLRLCRELRATGEQTDMLRRLELQLLYRYAPDQAFTLVDEFIGVGPPSYFVAFKNVLAIRLGQRDAVQLESSRLPGPADLVPEESYLVVLPYVASQRYDDALEFLYAQLRLYFEDERAHGQYLGHFLTYGGQTTLRQPPNTVQSACAVLLEVEGGTRRWVVVEDQSPMASRDEFSESSEIVQRLLNRTVADVVELPSGLGPSERATVREIQTKYVRAFQDCLENFRKRFPETAVIQHLHVGSGDAFDPAPLIESLKERRTYVTESIELYRTNPCPLHLFANRVGVSELEAVKALAQQPMAKVRCCDTTPREFAHAVTEGVAADTLVVDISAIVSLSLLDGWDYLDSRKKYVASRSTMDRIDSWLDSASEGRAHDGGHAAVTESGTLVFQETTKEQRETQRAELERIKQMVGAHCAVHSSEAAASLLPERRSLYEQALGFHNLESICVAKELGAILWSDDLMLAVIAQSEFAVKRVWTQLALRCCAEGGYLTMDAFHLMSAKLASWRYEQTIWWPETIIEAGAKAGWDVSQWPLRQCVALIGDAGLRPPARAQIALGVLKLLRRSSCNELRQSGVIQAILRAVGHPAAVAWMLGRLDLAFGVDFPSAQFVRVELEYWLAEQPTLSL